VIKKWFHFLFFIFILSVNNSFGQIVARDEKDSIQVFNEINQYSKKNKFTKFIYKNFFKTNTITVKINGKKKLVDSLTINNCKIIRQVKIQVFDPFGHEIVDTLKRPLSIFQNAGNIVHIKSSRFAIKNFLLFHRGDEYDSYKLSETERLMRQSDLFREILITTIPIDGNPDSVDLNIKVIDKWSLLFALSANPDRARFSITEKNFLGLGHETDNTFDYNKQFGLDAYQGRYKINRIGNTFASANIVYVDKSDHTSQKAFEIVRPFFSPITHWAVGFLLDQSVNNDKWYLTDTIINSFSIKSNILDFFISRSINLKQQGINVKKFAPNQNLIFSVRSLSNQVLSNGSLGDSLGLYKNRNYLLGMVAISYVGYNTDSYIFKFGVNEDIPVGNFYGFIAGYDYLNESNYIGFRLGSAKLTPRGYFSFFAEAGKYAGNPYSNSAVLNLEATYYSPLFSIGKWNFRQFVKPRITLGWDQNINKALILSSNEGIQGFSNENIFGAKRATFYLQTQAYSPYSVFGFRFGPALFFNGGVVSDNNPQLFNNRLFAAVGFGVVFKNEYLTLNAFDVSIAFYSYIPTVTNDYKVNAFRTVHFDLRDINIDKPEFVDYK